MFRNTLLICLTFGFLLACSADDSVDPNAPAESANREFLSLVNKVRSEGCNCGTQKMPPAPPLVWNEKLEAAALAHSKDMSENNFFDHTNQKGESPGDRIKAQDYRWQTYGENIAKGQQTVSDAHKSWLNSPGHCKNMMNPNFKEMGVAEVNKHWTQVFATSF